MEKGFNFSEIEIESALESIKDLDKKSLLRTLKIRVKKFMSDLSDGHIIIQVVKKGKDAQVLAVPYAMKGGLLEKRLEPSEKALNFTSLFIKAASLEEYASQILGALINFGGDKVLNLLLVEVNKKAAGIISRISDSHGLSFLMVKVVNDEVKLLGFKDIEDAAPITIEFWDALFEGIFGFASKYGVEIPDEKEEKEEEAVYEDALIVDPNE